MLSTLTFFRRSKLVPRAAVWPREYVPNSFAKMLKRQLMIADQSRQQGGRPGCPVMQSSLRTQCVEFASGGHTRSDRAPRSLLGAACHG